MNAWIVSQNFKKRIYQEEKVFIDGITEHDSKYPQNVWNIFDMKNLGKTFRDTSRKTYNLDPGILYKKNIMFN